MEGPAEAIMQRCTLQMLHLQFGRHCGELCWLRRCGCRPVGSEHAVSPTFKMGVLGLCHGEERIWRLRRVAEELIDGIPEDLRNLVFEKPPCAGVAKQCEDSLAPRGIRRRTIIQLSHDLRILRVE